MDTLNIVHADKYLAMGNVNVIMLNMAISIARRMEGKFRTVAIVVNKRGRIIAIGINSLKKTHPRQAYYAKMAKQDSRIYLHAEVDAILKCKNDTPHAIYVARVGKMGESRLAAPCKICSMAIRDAGIKNVWYTG